MLNHNTYLEAKESSAWLLTVHKSMNIAVGDGVFSEYIIAPKVYAIPGAVSYCHQVIFWRGRYTPLFDFGVLLREEPQADNHIAVLAYQELPNSPVKHIAIKLYSQTEKIIVNDDSACACPAEYSKLMAPLLTSLFHYNNELVSVLNIADLANEGYRDFVLDFKRG